MVGLAEGGRERLGAGQQEDRFTELVGSGNEPESGYEPERQVRRQS